MGVPTFFADQLRNPFGHLRPRCHVAVLRSLRRAINQQTMRSLALEPTHRVLRVGFGSGDLIAHMAPVVSEGSVAGVDVSPDMVTVGAKRLASLVGAGRVELRCATAEALPYDDGHFTKACTVNTVYFCPAGGGTEGVRARPSPRRHTRGRLQPR